MHSSDVFIIAAWLIVLGLGTAMLHQAWLAHSRIDHGRMEEAREYILRTIGGCLFVAASCAVMFGIRFLITALVIPAITGCALFVIAVVLLLQARGRLRIE